MLNWSSQSNKSEDFQYNNERMRPHIKVSSFIALYHNVKTHTALSKEYGVSLSALGKWFASTLKSKQKLATS